jgi:hypothetical protein
MTQIGQGDSVSVTRGWEPMRLDYLGQVGELMRATTTGSKRDDPQKGCGSDRRKTGVGNPC